MKKKVVVYLNGATGNQLFEFFAGASLAENYKAKLIFDTSLLKPKKLRHPGGIEDLEILFDGRPYDYRIRKFRKHPTLILASRIVYKVLSIWAPARCFTKQFRSKVVGYDPNLALVKPSCEVFGFFQTFKHIESLKDKGRSIEVKVLNPSIWFDGMSRAITSFPNSVGIHLRRGDYANYKNLIGMLADEYFINILEEIEEIQTIDMVFIFSDSIESAELLREKIGPVKCLVIAPPDELKPAESMMLLSLCSYQVISNSTFSWWGSYFSGNSHRIYVPEPWFRNQPEPAMLIPNTWNRRRALWVD